MELAASALGDDPYCYRHQFLQLAAQAGRLSGEDVDVSVPTCDPEQRSRPETVPGSRRIVHTADADADTDAEQPPFDWSTFVIEFLRLLPPLLAMPVFVMALRRPRSRRD